MKTLRAGVIGGGWVATARHIPSLRKCQDVEIVSLLDRNPSNAKDVAGRFNIPATFSELDGFLDSGLDLVTICTPPWSHAELAEAALGAGLHVFCEKPMALNSEEAKRMVAASHEHDRLLCISHNFLFSRAVRKARRFVETAGPIRHAIAMQMSSLRRRLPDWYHQIPGGLLLDESPHMLYTLQAFVGPMTLEDLRVTLNPETQLPRSAEIWLRSEAAPIQLSMLFETALSEWHIGLIGTDAVIDLDLFRDITVLMKDDGAHKPLDILRSSLGATAQHWSGFATSGTRYATKRLYWGHDDLIARFVDAIRQQGTSPVPVEESLRVVELTDEILSRMEERRGSEALDG